MEILPISKRAPVNIPSMEDEESNVTSPIPFTVKAGSLIWIGDRVMVSTKDILALDVTQADPVESPSDSLCMQSLRKKYWIRNHPVVYRYEGKVILVSKYVAGEWLEKMCDHLPRLIMAVPASGYIMNPFYIYGISEPTIMMILPWEYQYAHELCRYIHHYGVPCISADRILVHGNVRKGNLPVAMTLYLHHDHKDDTWHLSTKKGGVRMNLYGIMIPNVKGMGRDDTMNMLRGYMCGLFARIPNAYCDVSIMCL